MRTGRKVKVEIPNRPDNYQATRQLFPFVFHTACDECLSGQRSLTMALNQDYASLAQTVDRSLHRALIDMAELETAISTIILDSERRGRGPGQLEPEIDARLQRLFRKAKEIHARALG